MMKMTYAKALEVVLNGEVITDEVREKLIALKASVEKKNTGERKLTATQKQNLELKDAIIAFMEVGKGYTVTDIMKGCEAVADMSNQRVSALVRQLKEANLVTREEMKGKAYFTLAD